MSEPKASPRTHACRQHSHHTQRGARCARANNSTDGGGGLLCGTSVESKESIKSMKFIESVESSDSVESIESLQFIEPKEFSKL